MTHYDILGVPFDASFEEIRKAYRKKIFDLHPDRNQSSPHSEEAIRWISAAYETLCDPEKRAEYDLGLRVPEEGEARSAARLSYFVAVTAFAREQVGLVALLTLAPLGKFPCAPVLYLLTLLALSLGLMPLMPEPNSAKGFERRSMLLISLYLIFWVVFNPLTTGSREDLLFCLSFGQLVGNVMCLIATRMREEQGLSIRFLPFIVSLVSSLMVVLQFTVFLGKEGEAQIVGSDGTDWGALVILLVAASAISAMFSREAGAEEEGDSEESHLVVRL